MTDWMDRPFPPGPRDPCEDTPGAEVTLTPHQVATIADIAARTQRNVRVEDRGASCIRVTTLGPGGEELSSDVVHPNGKYVGRVRPGRSKRVN